MNEAETRAEHIDPALRAAGWGVVEGSRVRREFPITLGRLESHGRRGKALSADYVLEYRNHKLAVIEAKAWDCPLTEGVAQAKDYAGKLAIRFTYATNGQGIYGIDMQEGTEGEQAHYPTPEELWQMTFATQNNWRDRFAAVPFEDRGGYFQGRYYQDIAIERVLEAIADGRERILLTLATGTGKTFIAFQLAWKLFHSRWNLSDWPDLKDGRAPSRRPRILFLADRNILANQAYNAFSAFPEDALVRIEPDDIRKKGRVPKNGSLFFTIFQTFMSGPPKDGQPSPYFGEYPPDFFDFIIVDECHRGGANDESTWRDILNYFAPAAQLGLTATPKRRDNVDTYAYFGEPVYVYSLKEGINDGFLTPFKVKQISTTLDEYVYTPDDQLIEGQVEIGRRYTEGEFNRIIENIVLMRPINSMIEFKQIIGRGTRLFDGKAYFTIYDFVRAHHHFNDPEWDGEPEDNTTEGEGEGESGQIAGVGGGQHPPDEGGQLRPRPARIKVKLADGKARNIQHMMVTSFWHPDGTPMSAQQFLEMLFGKLPEFFKNEEELRTICSEPDTRARLLQGLAERGFGREQMAEMQKIIDAEQRDLFDVLAHVAYALPPLTREERAARAKVEISAHFNNKQQAFLDFVLSQYVKVGVDELDQEKLAPLLRLKYNNSIPDAVGDLGEARQIRKIFTGFQRFLYQSAARNQQPTV